MVKKHALSSNFIQLVSTDPKVQVIRFGFLKHFPTNWVSLNLCSLTAKKTANIQIRKYSGRTFCSFFASTKKIDSHIVTLFASRNFFFKNFFSRRYIFFVRVRSEPEGKNEKTVSNFSENFCWSTVMF